MPLLRWHLQTAFDLSYNIIYYFYLFIYLFNYLFVYIDRWQISKNYQLL